VCYPNENGFKKEPKSIESVRPPHKKIHPVKQHLESEAEAK